MDPALQSRLSKQEFVSVCVKAGRFSGYISGTSKHDRPRS
jgi:hypothetical protein